MEILKIYGIDDIKNYIRKNKYLVLCFIFILLLIFLFTRIIIDVDVITNNQNLQRTILNELDKEGIRKYSFIKKDSELLEKKERILHANKDLLEWINIERKGMRYVVNIEPKVEKNKQEREEYCHVVSLKDAMITRIIASNGVEVKGINDSVKKDDIIISGDIAFNEEIKSRVCAMGEVYGKTWYTINISLPKNTEVVTRKEKKRFNLEIDFTNKKYKIFKDRLRDYVSESKRIINIFGFELKLVKEIEVEREIRSYTALELEENINKLVLENMAKTLEGDYKIIEQKVLKKSDNDSTIDIEMFIVAEEKISEVRIATINEEKEEKE